MAQLDGRREEEITTNFNFLSATERDVAGT